MAPSDDPLQHLAQRAESAVAAQQERSAEMAAKADGARQRSGLKRALLIVLLIACVASLVFQWRAMREPFPVPQPGESAAVVEGDLRAIAVFVDAFRLSQGRHPENLDEVRLPDSIAALVRAHGVRYERMAEGYTLLWALPSQRVVYDGADGHVQLTPAKQP